MQKYSTCKYYVSGIHCKACEMVIDNNISKLKGVVDSATTQVDSSVTIKFKDGQKPTIDKLNKEFLDLGYSFTDKPIGQATFSQYNIFQAIVIAIIGIIGYIIVEDLGIFSKINVNSQSSLSMFVVLGIFAGLSSCAALVGGIVLAMSKQWNQLYGGKEAHRRALPFVLFNTGRLVSFAVFGGLLGAIGSVFQISLQLLSVFVVFVSVFMVVIGFQMLGFHWAKKINLGFPKFLSTYAADHTNFKGKYMPFVTGAMTFFVPCGFTLIAQTIALSTGNILTSGAIMLAFAIGTLPSLAFLSFSSLKFQNNSGFSGTFNLLAGAMIVIFGIININSQLNVLGVPSLNNISSQFFNTVNPIEKSNVEIVGTGKDQYQKFTIEVKGFEYLPRSIALKAGILTKVTVNIDEVIGCAQAMWLGGLYDKVVYLSGKQQSFEFIPKKGNYKISCTMGMVNPIIVTVE